jgi:protein gp37
MNKTKIDWCDQTWNPVTGCLHGCPYCYARKIARRFGRADSEDKSNHTLGSFYEKIKPQNNSASYNPFGFDPTFHRYRLNEPAEKKKPQNIFVCSMSDLFGDWVPDSWIEEVFDHCYLAPQHRYLFLTKNPKRYREFLEAEEIIFWLGTTVTTQKMYDDWADVFRMNKFHHHYGNLFLSIEPMQEQINIYPEKVKADWIIIGSETGNRKGKVIPERKWIEAIVNECRRTNTPIFMKDSLRDIWKEPLIREYPWEVVN